MGRASQIVHGGMPAMPIFLNAGQRLEVDVEPHDPMDLTGLPLEVVSSTIRLNGPNRVVLEATRACLISPEDLFISSQQRHREFLQYRNDLSAYIQYRNELTTSLHQEDQQ